MCSLVVRTTLTANTPLLSQALANPNSHTPNWKRDTISTTSPSPHNNHCDTLWTSHDDWTHITHNYCQHEPLNTESTSPPNEDTCLKAQVETDSVSRPKLAGS